MKSSQAVAKTSASRGRAGSEAPGLKVVGAASSGKGAKRQGRQSAAVAVDAEEMIRQAAYFRAEKRGFVEGAELQDWLEAEQEVWQSLSACEPAADSTRQ